MQETTCLTVTAGSEAGVLTNVIYIRKYVPTPKKHELQIEAGQMHSGHVNVGAKLSLILTKMAHTSHCQSYALCPKCPFSLFRLFKMNSCSSMLQVVQMWFKCGSVCFVLSTTSLGLLLSKS